MRKYTDCCNLLTPWRGARQDTLAYQCREWWRSSGTHQSEPHWSATRHFPSWASISSRKASLKPDCGSSLYLPDGVRDMRGAFRELASKSKVNFKKKKRLIEKTSIKVSVVGKILDLVRSPGGKSLGFRLKSCCNLFIKFSRSAGNWNQALEQRFHIKSTDLLHWLSFNPWINTRVYLPLPVTMTWCTHQ